MSWWTQVIKGNPHGFSYGNPQWYTNANPSLTHVLLGWMSWYKQTQVNKGCPSTLPDETLLCAWSPKWEALASCTSPVDPQCPFPWVRPLCPLVLTDDSPGFLWLNCQHFLWSSQHLMRQFFQLSMGHLTPEGRIMRVVSGSLRRDYFLSNSRWEWLPKTLQIQVKSVGYIHISMLLSLVCLQSWVSVAQLLVTESHWNTNASIWESLVGSLGGSLPDEPLSWISMATWESLCHLLAWSMCTMRHDSPVYLCFRASLSSVPLLPGDAA